MMASCVSKRAPTGSPVPANDESWLRQTGAVRPPRARAVARLPDGFTREVAELLRTHEHNILRAEAGRLELDVADLDSDDADWLAQTASLPEQLRALGLNGAAGSTPARCRQRIGSAARAAACRSDPT